MKSNRQEIAPATAVGMVLGLIGALSLFSATASAQTYLYSQADLPTGSGPTAVIAADFNGDGRPDLAVVNSGGTISILLSQADGTFGTRTDFPTRTSPTTLVVADFNADGKLDLATLSTDADLVSVLLGNGDGTFRPHVDYATGGGPSSLVAADLNGDGKPDVAVTNRGDGTVSLFAGNGDGTFQPQTVIATVPGLQWGTTGDFNGDGKTDLVLAADEIVVLLNNGNGTFRRVNTPFSFPSLIAVGDFNGDGKLDIAVDVLLSSEFSVLLGNGDGTFQPPTGAYGAEGVISFILAADVNHDVRLDLVTSDLSVFLGRGDGTFQPPLSTFASVGRSCVASYPPGGCAALADFNGDGQLDLAGLAGSSDFVNVLLGDGKGTFGSQLTVTLPSSHSLGPALTADFNGDGKPDVAVVQNNDAVPGSVSVLLGKVDGTFQTPVSSPLTSDAAFAMVAGDFNADGKADLALLDFNNAKISVLLGKGDGTFRTSVDSTLPSGLTPQSFAAGDFNGDGKADLAVTATNPVDSSTSLNILLGNGDGTFQSSGLGNVNTFGVSSIIAADFNDDHKLDLVVTTSTGFSIYLGNGNGGFASPVPYGTGSFPFNNTPVPGDFNADGKLDLAVATGNGLSVFLGNGDGTFQTPMSTPTTSSMATGPAADFNGDGKLDLLMSSGVALGNGDGTFQTPLPLPNGASSAAIGDFNSDRIADVLSTLLTPFASPIASVWLSAPSVSFYPSRLTFPSQTVGTSSPPQMVSVANAGNSSLSLTNIAATGDFSETNSCGSTLAIGATCTFSVTFTPTLPGSRTGSLTITDNNNGNSGSVQTVALAGTGVGPLVSLSVSSVALGAEIAGTASSAQTIKLTNTGNASLAISGIVVSGTNAADFAETNTCGSSLATGAACTISITFMPAGGGNRSGTLTITDNAPGSPQSVALSGVGQDFQITPNIGGETVTAGQSGGFGLSIVAVGGLTQSIAFACSGAPSESTCTLSPASVTPNGSAASVVQVTLSTTAPSMLGPRPRSSPPVTGGPKPYLTPPLVLVLMMLASFLWVARWRAQPIAIRWYLRAAMSSALLLLALTVPGCGGGGAVAQHNPGTPAGTYSLTVTGTVTSGSATLTHNVVLKVTVQ